MHKEVPMRISTDTSKNTHSANGISIKIFYVDKKNFDFISVFWLFRSCNVHENISAIFNASR